MTIDIGRINYEAYLDMLGTEMGDVLIVGPPWEQLSQPEQNAWRAGASTVIYYVKQEEMKEEA